LRNSGIGPDIAASSISIVGLAMFVGRLSAGVMLDRWFSPNVTAVYVGLSLIGMGLMLIAPSPPAFFLAAGLLGLGLGSELDAAAYMVSRAFGLRSFGAIYGLITLGYGVCGALGTGAINAAIAAGVASSIIFAIGTGMLAVAVILLTTIRRDHLPFDITS
jgi:MFS family permease